jgi:hypothetical protein
MLDQREIDYLKGANWVLANKASMPEVEHFRNLCNDILKFMEGRQAIKNRLEDFDRMLQGNAEMENPPNAQYGFVPAQQQRQEDKLNFLKKQ